MISPRKSRLNSRHTTLRGLTWDHPRAYAPLEAAGEQYARSTGVQVTWDRRSLKDFGDQSLDSLASEYELLVIDHPHVGIAAEEHVLVPLDEYLDEAMLDDLARDSPGGSHQSYFYDGHQWALAIDSACQVAAIRPDLLARTLGTDAKAPGAWPATWLDAMLRAKELRAHNLWLGMALCPTDCACSFLTWMAQSGTPLDESGVNVSWRSTVNTLECLRRLAALAHPLSTSWNPIQLYEAMTAGNEIAYSPLAFGYSNYTERRFRSARLSFGPIPDRSRALLGGAGIAVSRQAKDIEVGVSFAAFLAGGECQAGVYLCSGGQPAHALAWHQAADDCSGSFLAGTAETLRNAYIRPRCAWWPKFQPLLGDLIHEFLTSGRDTRVTADEINERYSKCSGMN